MKSLVGERRAVAAAVLSFYGFVYLLFSMAMPSEWTTLFWCIAGLYGVAFVGVVAGWFWGRWFAQGLGYWGLVTGVLGVWQMGPEPIIVFLTLSHAVVALFLAGDAMAAGFDGRPEWRARFHLDEGGVDRLGKSVTRASMSLPILLMWALAPTQPSSLFAHGTPAVLVPVALAAAGAWALLRLRTWGLFALAGSAGAVIAVSAATPVAIAAVAALAAALVPFAAPMGRALRA
ncbi:MAG: hypothetical protein KBD62_38075 [Kofleriaceae bacterium]|jgi:hypothetical protein|nr:hypothetical protein [Kofleriaceae bacterium]